MATDESMDDDVFETQEETNNKLCTKKTEQKTNSPSPTGYRNYQPPAEVLKLCQTDVLEVCEQTIHKV